MFGKVWFTIDGTSKMPFLKFFPFSLFKILNAYCQKFCVKTILFYNEFRGFLWSSTTSQIYLKYLFLTMKPTALLIIFFQICEEILFASSFSLNERNISTSLLMMNLKCNAVHYAKLNSSLINKPFLNYGPVNMLFCFFYSYLCLF